MFQTKMVLQHWSLPLTANFDHGAIPVVIDNIVAEVVVVVAMMLLFLWLVKNVYQCKLPKLASRDVSSTMN